MEAPTVTNDLPATIGWSIDLCAGDRGGLVGLLD